MDKEPIYPLLDGTEIATIAKEMGLKPQQVKDILKSAKKKFISKLERRGLDSDYFFKD